MMERFPQDHLEQASPGANLLKTCLHFSVESNDSASPVVAATQERKQRVASMNHRSAEAPMCKPWTAVLQTGKQGVGPPHEASQDLAKLPRQNDPSIPQSKQSFFDLLAGR